MMSGSSEKTPSARRQRRPSRSEMSRDFCLVVIGFIFVLGAVTTSDFQFGVTRATALKLSTDEEAVVSGQQFGGEGGEHEQPPTGTSGQQFPPQPGYPAPPQPGYTMYPPPPQPGYPAPPQPGYTMYPLPPPGVYQQEPFSGGNHLGLPETKHVAAYPPPANQPYGHLQGLPATPVTMFPTPSSTEGPVKKLHELEEAQQDDYLRGCKVPPVFTSSRKGENSAQSEDEDFKLALPHKDWFIDAVTEGKDRYALAKKRAGLFGRFRESKLFCSPTKLTDEMINAYDTWTSMNLGYSLLTENPEAKAGITLLMNGVAFYGLRGWISRKLMCGKWAMKRGPKPKCDKSETNSIWKWLKDIKMCGGVKAHVCSHLQKAKGLQYDQPKGSHNPEPRN